MVRNDADQSFASLSLTELLHPEAAASNITRRHNDESPWATVYYEAVSGPHSDDDVPVTFEVVEIHDDMEDANLQQPRDLECCAPPQHTAGTLRPLPKPKPWQHSNLIDLILGFSFTFAAFICTIKIELTAILLYTMAAGFHYLAEEVFSSTPAMLGKSICLIVCGVLMVFDPILLTVSVMVTELLGVIALLLCTIFGGARSGNSWHQYVLSLLSSSHDKFCTYFHLVSVGLFGKLVTSAGGDSEVFIKDGNQNASFLFPWKMKGYNSVLFLARTLPRPKKWNVPIRLINGIATTATDKFAPLSTLVHSTRTLAAA